MVYSVECLQRISNFWTTYLGEFKGAIADLSYLGQRGDDSFLNDWVHPTLNTTHTIPDQVMMV